MNTYAQNSTQDALIGGADSDILFFISVAVLPVFSH